MEFILSTTSVMSMRGILVIVIIIILLSVLLCMPLPKATELMKYNLNVSGATV